METKYLVNLAAAFIPLIIGAVWYHPKAFGAILKPADSENIKTGHAWWVYVLTYIGGYYIASTLSGVTIHQYGIMGMFASDTAAHTAGTPLNTTLQGLLDNYADNYRTFKHGAYHAYHLGLYLVFPILTVITLFEKKRWTYLAVHSAYWIICLTLMGGVVCAYMPTHIQLAK